MRRALAFLLTTVLAAQQPAATRAQAPQEEAVFRTSTNLVIVTVFVRDKQGKPLAGLKKEDFTLLENGKPQAISVFDYQKLDVGAAPPSDARAGVTINENAPGAAAAARPRVPEGRERFRDKRLLVLFFDWTSMGPADQVRAKESAEKFVKEKITAADLVQIVSFGSRLKVEQEFTDDRDVLLDVIQRFQTGTMSELATAGETDPDTGDDVAYSADDTEFNIFNTDRKLTALEDMARKLAPLPEKKALVYFSSGVSRNGTENESQLRATINAAVRANVSFYPVDVRGLQALPPGGGAATAGRRGTGLFTGQTQTQQRQSQLDSQDTLSTLAEDTGGRALFDTNDLTQGIQQAQQDLQSYYILGYYSSDERKDGQFRKVDVKLAPKIQAKVDFRNGYFAEKDFKAFNRYDKEKQLQDALLLGDPVTDLPIALEVNWFRFGRDRYFVPVAVKIPGSAIPLKKQGSAETTEFDFLGQITNAKGVQLSVVRDTIQIKLRDENAGKLGTSSMLYDTGFTLAPGSYKMKMLVRENQTGKMGTYQTRFVIPDLAQTKDATRLSSVVWSSQRIPITEAIGAADKKVLKKQDQHPLVRGQQKLVPSVSHVFRTGQTLSAYAEVYDPARPEGTPRPAVSAVVALYRDKKLIAQSQPVRVNQLQEDRTAAQVLVDMPLRVPAGEYVAQLTVIDEQGQKFGTSRTEVRVLPERPVSK
jgi:VWFA-related protein